MSFNLGPSKKSQEVIFDRKLKKASHPFLVINNVMFPNVNLKNT